MRTRIWRTRSSGCPRSGSNGARAAKSEIVESPLRRAFSSIAGTVGAAVIGRAEPRSAARHALLPIVVPIVRPLPHVADHVVKAEAIRRERADRRGVEESVAQFVVARPLSLPEVCASR